MKTNFLLLALAAAAVTGCSKEASLPYQGNDNIIEFSTVVSKQTKAPEVNLDALKTGEGFQLYTYYTESTYETAAAVPVTWINANMVFKAPSWGDKNSGVFYWPSSGYLSTFCYYPISENSVYHAPAAGSEYPYLSVTVPAAAESQADLIAAGTQNSQKGETASPITIDFKHILSQVKFQAKVENTNYKVKVKNITVNAYNQADFKYNGQAAVGAWENLATATTTAFVYRDTPTDFIASTAGADLEESGKGALMLIPQPASADKFTFEVTYDIYYTTADNTDVLLKEATKSADMETLAAGKKYIYLLTLTNTADPISFEVTDFDVWSPAGNTDK